MAGSASVAVGSLHCLASATAGYFTMHRSASPQLFHSLLCGSVDRSVCSHPLHDRSYTVKSMASAMTATTVPEKKIFSLNDPSFQRLTKQELCKVISIRTTGCDSAQVRKMADLCPNLTEVELTIDDGMTADDFDFVCGKWRKVEELQLDFGQMSTVDFFESPKLVQFWSLPLRLLEVNQCRVTDTVLIKIAKSFPRLETLLFKDETDVSERGIEALSQLRNLVRVKLDMQPYGWQGVFEEARMLARCPLIEVEFINGMMSVSVLTLIRFCPTLRFVRLFDIDDIDSAEAAGEMMRSMEGIRKEDFILEFSNELANEIWDSEEVKDVLDVVNEKNRCRIVIIAPDLDVAVPDSTTPDDDVEEVE